MRKAIFLMTLLLGVFIYAQEEHREINTEFKELMDATFASLEKNRVPHGILLDFGMEFTNVPAFNGTLTDSTYTDAATLKQLYNTLLMSRIVEEEQSFVSPEQFSQNWQDNRGSEHIALSGLYYKYSAFAEDAYPERLHYEEDRFLDKYEGETWLDPYEEKQTFAITPPILWYKGLSFDVLLPQEIFYSNTTEAINYIEADFDDGQGYRELPFDEAVTVQYGEEGNKIWKYRVVLGNDEVLHAQSKIKITAGLERKAWNGGIQSGHSTYTQDITATTAYLGQYGEVTLTIDLANPNEGIQKPLIVAEGFDIGTLLDPENTEGMEDYEGFRRRLLTSGSQLQLLIRNSNKQYDIIYVDWDNGADYLQRNAYALQAVIAWVNQQKSINNSTEPNVVLGQSMGGVIARYALTDMEENSFDHDTRLFISHDAPQQGANVPMSFQYLYRHMTNQYITASTTLFGGTILVPLLENNFGASTYLSILDTPAARQMLKIWSNPWYGMDNTVHNNFYNELKGLNNNDGYPLETRNISVSNGSECGDTQDFHAGAHLLDFQHNQGLSFWGDLASLIYNPLGGAIGGLFLDPNFFGVGILGILPGSSRYQIDFQAKSLSYQNDYQIYKGLVRYKKKILWVFNSQVTITHVQRNQPSNILPYDHYGGGYFDTGELAQGISDALPNAYLNDKFGFIPTVSSLDIGAGSTTLNDQDYKRSYVGASPPSAPKNSPFANFSTDFNPSNPNSQNYRHLAFNPRNGDWLADELNEGQPAANCSFVCDNLTISGPSLICNSPVVFTVPQGAGSFNWQIQNPYLVNLLSGTTGNSITLSRNGSNNGWVTLTAAIDGGSCGSVILTKNVYVGVPIVESIEEVSVAQTGHILPIAPISDCDDFGLKLNFAPSFTNVEDMEWEKVTTNYQWSQGMPGNSNQYVVIAPECNGPIKFKVRMKNSCGWSDWQELEYNVTQCSTNCSSNPPGGIIDSGTFLIWPVPVSTTLWVQIKGEEPGLLQSGQTLTIQLYNSIGVQVVNINAIGTQTAVDVSSLPAGTYTLLITYNGVPESHQIIKN